MRIRKGTWVFINTPSQYAGRIGKVFFWSSVFTLMEFRGDEGRRYPVLTSHLTPVKIKKGHAPYNHHVSQELPL